MLPSMKPRPWLQSTPPSPLDCSSEFAAFEVRQATSLDCKRRHPTPPSSMLPLIPIGGAYPRRTSFCRPLIVTRSIRRTPCRPAVVCQRSGATRHCQHEAARRYPAVFARDQEPCVITMDTLICLTASELVEGAQTLAAILCTCCCNVTYGLFAILLFE
jgi:hypothetical protein